MAFTSNWINWNDVDFITLFKTFVTEGQSANAWKNNNQNNKPNFKQNMQHVLAKLDDQAFRLINLLKNFR